MSEGGSSVQAFLLEQTIVFKSQKTWKLYGLKNTNFVVLKGKLLSSYKKKVSLKSWNTRVFLRTIL